jgi:hypothetical protein
MKVRTESSLTPTTANIRRVEAMSGSFHAGGVLNRIENHRLFVERRFARLNIKESYAGGRVNFW